VKDPFAKNEVRVTVIGGGTGSFTILNSLKSHTHQIAAIVNMADDGSSTGVLRDELGTLPPGDIRQCLVALSDSPKIRELFDYRFDTGTFKGHAFGNLLLTALEKVTGDFSEAVETASEILRIHGTVIPATLDDVRLKMEWPGTSLILHGERVIDIEYFKKDPRRAELSLVPAAQPNPTAIAAIEQADIVIIAPGDLYTSLGPLLIIDGIGDALKRTDALVCYVPNLVSKRGQTDKFTVSDHVKEIERFAGGEFLDLVLYNKQQPNEMTAAIYMAEGGYVTEVDKEVLKKAHYKAIGGDFLGEIASHNPSDPLYGKRSLIRHDAEEVIQLILKVYQEQQAKVDKP
jgi:uncharacterized cofD-like protein